MGTRASFWIGNPIDLDKREWLGCIAWDGYPDGDCEILKDAASPEEFRKMVDDIAKSRDDFSHPQKGWPFPWDNDIFITDCTYSFFDDATRYCTFRNEFRKLEEYLASDGEDIPKDLKHYNVPAPAAWNPKQPDSIMYVAIKTS